MKQKWFSTVGYFHQDKALTVRKLMDQYITQDSVCVEIGVFCGKSLMHLVENSSPKRIIAVDPFEGQVSDTIVGHAIEFHTETDHTMQFDFGTVDYNVHYDYDKVKRMFKDYPHVELIKAYSPIPDLELPIIDFAFIDGDHTLSGIINDLEWIYPVSDGVIVIDDIAILDVRQGVEAFCEQHNLTYHQTAGTDIAWIITEKG